MACGRSEWLHSSAINATESDPTPAPASEMRTVGCPAADIKVMK